MTSGIDSTGTGELLKIVPFRLILGVRAAWTCAIQMVLVAIAWQMYDLTGDAWSLALVGLCQFIPVLLLTLPAGQAADRWNRSRIMVVSLVTQAVASALIAWGSAQALVTEQHLLLASVLLGVARAFQMPSLQAITPTTVPPRLLSRAMAASSTSSQVSVITGPALGGLLLGFGVAMVYTVATVLMLLAMALAVGLKSAPAQAGGTDRSLNTLFSGLQYVWRKPVILGAITLDLFTVMLGGAIALLPIYARDFLHGGPSTLGWLRAAPAMGALVMSLYLVRKPPATRVGTRLLLAAAVFGLATITFGLSRSFALSMLALMVNGAADMVSVVIRQTLVQLDTPDAMRGRVSAVNSVFIGASNQLGEFTSGSAAALFGPVAAVVLGGAATCLVAMCWPKWFPELSRRDRLERRIEEVNIGPPVSGSP